METIEIVLLGPLVMVVLGGLMALLYSIWRTVFPYQTKYVEPTVVTTPKDETKPKTSVVKQISTQEYNQFTISLNGITKTVSNLDELSPEERCIVEAALASVEEFRQMDATLRKTNPFYRGNMVLELKPDRKNLN